jgi:hypothetical protein
LNFDGTAVRIILAAVSGNNGGSFFEFPVAIG